VSINPGQSDGFYDDPIDIQVTPLNFAAIPEGHPSGLF